MQTVAAEASPAQKRPRRTATDAGSQPMDQKVEVLNFSGCALRCRKIYRTRRTPNCWALAAACRLPGPAKGLRRINARAGLKNASCDPNQRRRGHQQLVRGSSGRLLYQHDFDGRFGDDWHPGELRLSSGGGTPLFPSSAPRWCSWRGPVAVVEGTASRTCATGSRSRGPTTGPPGLAAKGQQAHERLILPPRVAPRSGCSDDLCFEHGCYG